MGLPKSVVVYELGPREGFQIEKGPILTEDKISFVNALNKTGVTSIEVTSFVSPKWVPQMADAEKVLASIQRKEGVSYRAVYLNIKGLQRALVNNVTLDGALFITASESFSKRNTNKTISETVEDLPGWIKAYQDAGISVDQLGIVAAFGCNFDGIILLDHVLNLISKGINVAEEHGEKIKKVRLNDTMGWANPEQIKRTICAVKNKWPDLEILLHLHDTRGLGLANVYAALQEGVQEFDSAVAGLGGCPFAAVKGAAGNIATEDLAFMCEELGIETGLDIDVLLECAKMAEQIVGHELPGHLLKGGNISSKKKINHF